MRKGKYNNQKTEWNGKTYDSKKEAKRAFALHHAEKNGVISDLREQVVYKFEFNGLLICKYKADFVYIRDGIEVVEDVKGVRTDVYKLKKKLMKAFHGIDIFET